MNQSASPEQPDNKPVQEQGEVRSSLVVGVMTMLSRVLGLIRDVVIAIFFGANVNADAFFVAFKIPQFLRRLFAEGAFSQAFVPVLSEYKTLRSREAVEDLINRVAGVLGGILLVITGLAVVGAPVITAVFAPGFLADESKYQLTSELIRITFPYLFFISLTGFAGAVLNSFGRFAVPAFTPVLLNISLIVAIVVVAPQFSEPAYALAWGVFFAGVLQFTFQLPFLQRLQLLPKPKWDLKHKGVRRVMFLMVPALFGVSVSQINLMLDTILASFLPTGSVSWLYYSDRFSELPLGVFGIAIATVILPSLSRQQAQQNDAAFRGTLSWAICCVLAIGIPSAAGLIMLAKPILMTLLQYREMTVNDVVMASYSLCAYAAGLLAFMLIKVLAPGFYSRQDLKTPVKIGIIAMVANMVFNIALVIPLHQIYQVGHVGLAAATSLSAFLNAFLLYRALSKSAIYKVDAGVLTLFWKVVLASVLMALMLWQLTPALSLWHEWGWWPRAWNLALLCGAGIACYAIVLLVLGVRVSHFKPKTH